jgi:hypothetical protein
VAPKSKALQKQLKIIYFQPAVTKHIKELEEEYKIKIFLIGQVIKLCLRRWISIRIASKKNVSFYRTRF